MNPIDVLRYAAPVAIAAMGETIGQRSGVINIGLEGTMLSGAFAGFLVTHATGNPYLGLLVGMVVGLLVSALQAVFTLALGQDQVVVGTAINLLALGGTSTVYRTMFGQSGALIEVPSPAKFAGGMDAVLLGVLVALAAGSWVMRRTGWGLVLRAVGETPKAAEAAGYQVLRVRLGATLLNGFIAGLAGAYLAVGVSGSFTEGITAGRGFVAIALVTFGRWNLPWVFAGALLIGAAEGLQFWLQSTGFRAPYQLMLALPYVLALVVLVFAGKGTRAPGALGQPFRRQR